MAELLAMSLPPPVQASDSRGTAERDAQSVAAVLRGEREAYGDLVRRHSAMLRGYLRTRRGLRGADLDDAVQLVFVSAYTSLANLRAPAAFAGFLLKIAERVRVPRRKEAPLPGPPATPENEELWREDLRAAIARLPEAMQAVLALKFSAGLSAAEIAPLLDQPIGSVTKMLSRAYAKLREDEKLRMALGGKAHHE